MSLQKALRTLSKSSLWKRTNASIAKRVGRSYMKFFDRQTEEKKGPWKPRKDNEKHKLLKKTGKMRSGFKFRSNSKGFTIKNAVNYSGYHEEGGKHLPRRSAMDPAHSKEIDKIVENEIDKMLKKIGLF
jgi:phage gpG-like protein